MSTSHDGENREHLGASSRPAVRFDAVWLRRPSATLLRGVSFVLPSVSYHVLTGAAGSGKSALMRLMCLAESPSQGVVQLFGRDVMTLGRRQRTDLTRRIGAALQPAVFLDHLTVWENAALGPRVTGRRMADYRSEVDEVLAWMGLSRKADVPPAALDVAERQRLTIARAVVGGPEILLVDEPADGLPPEAVERLLKILRDYRQTGATLLLATRDPDVARAAGRPVLRLADGKITLDDDPARAP
jgi:cell division transport system ATP-binding protein